MPGGIRRAPKGSGHWPSDQRVAAWNGPYLKGGRVPDDPWGMPYVYRAPGEHGVYDIVSYGADGQEGGTGAAADITSASNE